VIGGIHFLLIQNVIFAKYNYCGLSKKERCIAVYLVVFGPGMSFRCDVAGPQFCGCRAQCPLSGKKRRAAGGLGPRNRNLLLGTVDGGWIFGAHSNCSAVVCDHFCSLGGTYLGWLGVRTLIHSSSTFDKMTSDQNGSPWRGAWEGGLIAFLNPKTGLFFLALFSPFVKPDTGTVWQGIMVITPFLTDGLWFSFVTLVLVRPRVLAALRARSLPVNRLSGIVLLLFSILVWWHAISSSVNRHLFFLSSPVKMSQIFTGAPLY
jgi:threonine/homoserine/homoserine lactone efflux protein